MMLIIRRLQAQWLYFGIFLLSHFRAFGWDISPDPPHTPVENRLAESFKVVLPRQGVSGVETVYPISGSPFVLTGIGIGRNKAELWNWASNQLVAELPVNSSDRLVRLSPDGNFLAVKSAGNVRLIDVRNPDLERILHTDSSLLQFMEFVSNSELAIVSGGYQKESLEIWSIADGKLLRQAKTESRIATVGSAVSPGRKYLALSADNRNEVLVFHLGEMTVTKVLLPKPDGAPWYDCDGLAFSPDGLELAGLFRIGRQKIVLISWDLKTGETVISLPVPMALKNTSNQFRRMSETVGLQWMPDRSGWLVYGFAIIDRNSGRPVWQLSSFGAATSSPPLVTDVDHLLTPRGNSLESVRIPWKQIDASLQAYQLPNSGLLRPGSEIQVDYQIKSVRHSEAATLKTELHPIIEKLLEPAQLKPVDAAPLALKIQYAEKEGEAIRIGGQNPNAGIRPGRPQPGQATAFAITEQGHLLTCAHVVGTSKTARIKIKDQKHDAKVLATDVPNDLALLKVEISTLTPLAISKGQPTAVGEDVRAFGYPMGDMFGETLKMTRGSIAGYFQRNGREQIYLDVVLLPGNSGGPTTNDFGTVVGVNSRASRTQKVGIAVPHQSIHEFLKPHNLPLVAPQEEMVLKGPEIIAKLGPSIVWVEVDDVNRLEDESETITSTDIEVELELRHASRDSRLWQWKHQVRLSSISRPATATTEAALRSVVSKKAQQALSEISIPYYISNDEPSQVLPVITVLKEPDKESSIPKIITPVPTNRGSQ